MNSLDQNDSPAPKRREAGPHRARNRGRSDAFSLSKTAQSLDIIDVLQRQRWLIIFMTCLCVAIAIAYAMKATLWYQSEAKVLIAQRSAGLSDSGTGSDTVDEDVLANHMGLIRSRRIISEALLQYDLMDLPSIQDQLGEGEDEVDYVMEHIGIARGGEGSAKNAAIMNITFQHSDPTDTQRVLTAVMKRYESYIVTQVEQLMGQAGEMINKAKASLESDLEKAEAEHLASLQDAPLFFQGEGSSNIYQDRYRRLAEESLDLDIQRSTLQTRLDRVRESLSQIEEGGEVADHLDKLALIDSESLERLGVFAGLQVSASNSAEFKAALPAKAEEARAQVTRLLTLSSERQKLTAVFGEAHPKVREINAEIDLVRNFLEKSKLETTPATTFGSASIKPDSLLRAYVGFIEHDIATLGERKRELELLAADAEKKAKELIEYELQDLVLRKRITRLESIFDGVVIQLESLNKTSGLGGYLYEFLEVPRMGKRIWPKLSVCLAAGSILGLLLGGIGAIGLELQDSRFRTAKELDDALGILNLGHVGPLPTIDQGVEGLTSADGSPEVEAFRLARTMLLPDIRSGELKSIGFTSSMQGDGKSTIVANLAQSLATVGLDVVVLDSDLRRPSQHRYLGMDNKKGLGQVLAGQLPLAEAIQRTTIASLSGIPAGPPAKNPAELLESPYFDRVVDALAKRFDVVLVDLPPVLAVSDPAVVLPRLSGAVLVVRASRIRREQLRNTMKRLNDSGVKFIGSMMNVVGVRKEFDAGGAYFGYYRAGYGESQKSKSNAKPKTGSKPRAAQPMSPISTQKRDAA